MDFLKIHFPSLDEALEWRGAVHSSLQESGGCTVLSPGIGCPAVDLRRRRGGGWGKLRPLTTTSADHSSELLVHGHCPLLKKSLLGSEEVEIFHCNITWDV